MVLGLSTFNKCTYLSGCECWDMGWAAGAVGAWNARRLAVLTGREIRSEYLEPSYDLIGAVRARRMQYVGHVLRLGEGRLLFKALEAEWDSLGGAGGGLLYDAPRLESFNELVMVASDRDLWRGLVEKIYKRKPKKRRK